MCLVNTLLRSDNDLVLQSKLVVLQSFSTFLRLSLSPTIHKNSLNEGNTAHPLNLWFMKNAFSTPEAFSAFEGLLTSNTSHADSKDKCLSRTWQAFVEPDDENDDSFSQRYLLTENPVEPWTFQEIQDLTSAGCRDNTQVASQEFVPVNIKFSFTFIAAHRTIQHLASTLHSTIIETFLDCAPSVFSPDSIPSETEVHLVVTVALIVRTLYHDVLKSSVCGDIFSYHHSTIYLGFRPTMSTWNT
jgi:pre-rRNA-processing protein IPI1